MTTVNASLPNDNEMASSARSPSLAISPHSLIQDVRSYIEGLRASSPLVSPASLLVWPENNSELPTAATSGPPQQTLFGLSSLDSSCLKMCPEYAPTCPWSSETCGDLATRFDDPSDLGLTIAEPHIDGNGSGLLRTPSAQEPGILPERLRPIEGGELGGMNRHFDKETGRMAQIGLSQQVALRQLWPTQCRLRNQIMWRTPNATDGSHGGPNARDSNGGLHLTAQVLRYWPTPRANDAEKRGLIANDLRNGLPAAALHWPTPTARDYRSQHAEDSLAFTERMKHPRGVNMVEELQRRGEIGQLNPTWVEWLMCWPLGWTSLDPLPKERYEEWKQSGAALWFLSEPQGVPRVAAGVTDRVNRLKALGNGQVPIVAATAWRLLIGIMGVDPSLLEVVCVDCHKREHGKGEEWT